MQLSISLTVLLVFRGDGAETLADTFILSIFASVLVVTGASEGIGRAYAFEVSKSASVHVFCILIMSDKVVRFNLFLLL